MTNDKLREEFFKKYLAFPEWAEWICRFKTFRGFERSSIGSDYPGHLHAVKLLYSQWQWIKSKLEQEREKVERDNLYKLEIKINEQMARTAPSPIGSRDILERTNEYNSGRLDAFKEIYQHLQSKEWEKLRHKYTPSKEGRDE